MSSHDKREVSYDQWLSEASDRFGASASRWRFKCPVCGHEASTQDWKDAGAGEGGIAFSCVGRWRSEEDRKTKGGCDYAGGGLFRLNPVLVKMEDGEIRETFEFGVPVESAT